MRQLETSSRIVLDYFATRINDNISYTFIQLIIYLATVARHSGECLTTFLRIKNLLTYLLTIRQTQLLRCIYVAFSLNGHLCDKFTNFGLILKIYLATVARLSHDSRETFGRVSHYFPANVAYFYFHYYDSRATVLRNI